MIWRQNIKQSIGTSKTKHKQKYKSHDRYKETRIQGFHVDNINVIGQTVTCCMSMSLRMSTRVFDFNAVLTTCYQDVCALLVSSLLTVCQIELVNNLLQGFEVNKLVTSCSNNRYRPAIQQVVSKQPRTQAPKGWAKERVLVRGL